MRIFKQVSCDRLLSPVKHGNCEIIQSEILGLICKHKTVPLQAVRNHTQPANLSSLSSHFFFSLKEIKTEDMKHLEANGLHYVCGYLLKKIKIWHNCSECISTLTCENGVKEKNEIFTNLKRYEDTNGLINVSQVFHKYVEILENKLIAVFDQNAHIHGVGNLLVNELQSYNVPSPCKYFPIQKFISFFVRLRIYYILKFKNFSLGSTSKHKVLKQFKHM
jgi:hypothetical protein